MRTSLFLAYTVLICAQAKVEWPVITTSYGKLRGYSYTADDGTEAHIFKKVPFAAAPVGELRWRKPQPPRHWNKTLDATFFGPACAQRTAKYDGPITGFSEDCLHLNIYTSRKCRESNATCPIAFVIHGGAGIFEAPMKYPDEILTRNFVSQDIIVVSTAYRLTMFGAMALGDENVLPANLNMHDVLAALAFTRTEIGFFGGDKDKITLLGQSEGAHMALLIAFSPGISKPGEKRLINGVISMSGNGGLETQEQTVGRTHAVTKELGCNGSPTEIMDCLRLLDTDTILAAAYKVHGTHILSAKSPFAVTMAGELFPITNEREMRESPDPIRIVLGTTIHEMEKNSVDGTNKVNRVLGVTNSEECYDKFLADQKSGVFDPNFNEGSLEIIMTTAIFAKYQAKIGGEAYLYEYGYPVHGHHTDDVSYVLGFHEFDMDDNEKWLNRVYPRYFTNFIKGLRPAADWSPLTPVLMNYYEVNRSISEDVLPHMRYDYQHEIVQYFEGIVEFDDKLSTVKELVHSAPIQYKSLNFTGNFQNFLESLTLFDALIAFCALVGATCLICCLCQCCTQICCCCCYDKRGYQSLA